jgi:isopenicillin N synthase-like dioxygenase
MAEPDTKELHLATANGYTTRTILCSPVREATNSEIPVIDVSAIFSHDLAAQQAVAFKIREAARNNGFFYIKNHGIPDKVSDTAYSACLNFFRQDMNVKSRTNANDPESFNNGFRAPDTQRLNANEGIDILESYAVGYDPKMDPSVTAPSNIPAEVARHYAPGGHPWEHTDNLPGFRNAIVSYFQECLKLARCLTRLFALSLDLDQDFFDDKVQYPEASFELNYYPPLDMDHQRQGLGDTSTRLSIGSHTDWQLFTILWQDSVGGLQVLTRDGQWIHAPPIPGTLVVNVADYMQRMTNDKYVSAVHRARNVSGKERVSIPFFWGFGLNKSCGVLDSCLEEGEERKYEEIKCLDWLDLRTSYMLDVGKK